MHRYPSSEPVVVTCALTGGIHGKEANERLPEQPDEIDRAVRIAAELDRPPATPEQARELLALRGR